MGYAYDIHILLYLNIDWGASCTMLVIHNASYAFGSGFFVTSLSPFICRIYLRKSVSCSSFFFLYFSFLCLFPLRSCRFTSHIIPFIGFQFLFIKLCACRFIQLLLLYHQLLVFHSKFAYTFQMAQPEIFDTEKKEFVEEIESIHRIILNTNEKKAI